MCNSVRIQTSRPKTDDLERFGGNFASIQQLESRCCCPPCSSRKMVICKRNALRGNIYGRLQDIHLQIAYSCGLRGCHAWRTVVSGRPRVPGSLIRDGNGYHRNRARWNEKTVCPVGGRSLRVASKDVIERRYTHKLLQASQNCAKMLIFKCFCLLATTQRFAELSITYCFECRLETLLTTVQVRAGPPNTALRYKVLSAVPG